MRLVPLVANPQLPFGGVLLERLCSALADEGATTLLVDAAQGAQVPAEMAVMDLADCLETLSPDLSYLAARTLPLRYVDACGSTAPFLQAVVDAAPGVDVVLVHASASELARMFARQALATQVWPVLLANDHPASVTQAYASMKLLALRSRLMVYQLLLGAAPASARAPRIAEKMASCADNFLGALLHDWALVDPACHPADAPSAALRRLVRAMLSPAPGDAAASGTSDAASARPPAWQGSAFAQALN